MTQFLSLMYSNMSWKHTHAKLFAKLRNRLFESISWETLSLWQKEPSCRELQVCHSFEFFLLKLFMDYKVPWEIFCQAYLERTLTAKFVKKLPNFCLVGLTLFSFLESRNLEKLLLHPSGKRSKIRLKWIIKPSVRTAKPELIQDAIRIFEIRKERERKKRKFYPKKARAGLCWE